MDKKTNHLQTEDEISIILNDVSTVTKAIQTGINTALLRHKQSGNPICVWRDGKVIWIAPDKINIIRKSR